MGRFTGWALWASLLSILFIVHHCFHLEGSFDSIRTLLTGTISVADAEEGTEGASIAKLKVEPLYRAVRLTWKAKINDDGPVTFEIYRSMARPDEPYTLVTSIEKKPGVEKYKYIDKNLPVEENYFYKILIPEKKESFGPHQVRPPFSLPTT